MEGYVVESPHAPLTRTTVCPICPDIAAVNAQTITNAHLMTANIKSEDWERTEDGRLTGVFEIVNLEQTNPAVFALDDTVSSYVAVLTYQQSGFKRDFIAQGPSHQLLEHALVGLLSVTSQTLNTIRHRVLNYGWNLEEVGGGLVLAALLT